MPVRSPRASRYSEFDLHELPMTASASIPRCPWGSGNMATSACTVRARSMAGSAGVHRHRSRGRPVETAEGFEALDDASNDLCRTSQPLVAFALGHALLCRVRHYDVDPTAFPRLAGRPVSRESQPIPEPWLAVRSVRPCRMRTGQRGRRRGSHSITRVTT